MTLRLPAVDRLGASTLDKFVIVADIDSVFRSQIFWKLLLAFAALNLLAAISLVRITLNWLEEGAFRDAETELSAATLLLSESYAGQLTGKPAPDLADRLALLGGRTRMHYTLLAADGELVADGKPTAGSPDDETINYAELPEVVEALDTGFGFDSSGGSSGRPPVAAVALRVSRDGQTLGVVRAAMPVIEIEERTAALRDRYLYFAIGIGVVMLGVSYAIVRHIVTPVLTLGKAADAIAAGDYQQRAFVPNNDELGALAKSFNRMSQELGSQLTELREIGQRQATVLGGMIEGVIAIDERQRVLFANAAAGKLFDFIPPEVEGRPLLEVVRHHALSQAVAAGLTSSRPQRLEVEWEGVERLILSTQVTPLPGDPCPGAVVVMHDTTELRRLETLRREFVANVSHELKTPLTSIKAYAETLINGARNDEQHCLDFLNRIEEQADRLNNLIQDMLSLARIESEQQPFDIARIVVADVADACVEDYQAQAEAKQITLTTDTDAPDAKVKADPEGLRVILSNLIDNAIKYTPAGGSVSMRWSLPSSNGAAHSSGAADTDDPMVCIEVADTGVGIPEAEMPRVFERFYRVDKARSRELGGTGLGLSIVKHLAQSFGGSVAVSSVVDEGTTFSVDLPAG